ncbi:glucokinase [Parathalassolituus penaei]|uniref:Glucokinase n=1 Tax=Parathalassolituus penaei TaxID=2997323 RepID=A0A9X3IRA2_9GAMM|nr:glucokinase [Parathalassolituus penaei]MCY0965032.1 glucokinase [Parathalassolituus penaei]
MSNAVLVGDIGGTNARFAWIDSSAANAGLQQVITLATADHSNIDEAIREYCSRAGIAIPTRACLALACPVDGEDIRMTNNHWFFNRQQLSQALGLQQLKLVNDFTAQALGMLCVDAADLLPVGAGTALPQAARLVIGPGTGLGVGSLAYTPNGWLPLPGEGGHVSLAPHNEQEDAILVGFRRLYGRVSVERVLSGQGLLDLYGIMAELRGVAAELDSPAAVSSAALENPDSLAGDVLRQFFRMLGSVAGDNSLTIGCRGGVYLCGGILPRVRELFLSSPDFRQGFENKGRFREYLAAVPVWLCVAENPGLLGAAAALDNPLVRG